MGDVAVETRKRLDLVAEASKKSDDDTPPKLPKKKGGPPRGKSKPNTTGIASEIDQMNTALTEDT
jgi:hypothetical protein